MGYFRLLLLSLTYSNLLLKRKMSLQTHTISKDIERISSDIVSFATLFVRESTVEAVADALEMNDIHCIVDTLGEKVKMGIDCEKWFDDFQVRDSYNSETLQVLQESPASQYWKKVRDSLERNSVETFNIGL